MKRVVLGFLAGILVASIFYVSIPKAVAFTPVAYKITKIPSPKGAAWEDKDFLEKSFLGTLNKEGREGWEVVQWQWVMHSDIRGRFRNPLATPLGSQRRMSYEAFCARTTGRDRRRWRFLYGHTKS